MKGPLSAILEANSAVDGDCLVWTGLRLPKGYGRLRCDGKSIYAHRAAYELAFGPIPSGKSVLHRCDNPPCIKPTHLFIGTAMDNRQDMLAKNRQPLTTRPHRVRRGIEHHGAKLTEADVLAIRASRLARKFIAAEFGVTNRTIGKILRRERWRHV